MITTSRLTIQSSDEAPELIDITEEVEKSVEKSKLKNGQVLVYAQHTTAAIIIQEKESLLHEDLRIFLKHVAPSEVSRYKHSNAPDHIEDQKPNGHSHCQHLFLGASEVVPVENGKMLLGTYQRLFLVELDHSRSRTIVIQLLGE